MIIDKLLMNGYGIFVWSAFAFTMINFTFLYFVTKFKFEKEKNKFVLKYGSLNPEQSKAARGQATNRKIISGTTVKSKI